MDNGGILKYMEANPENDSASLRHLKQAVDSLTEASKIHFLKRHEKMHATISAMHSICFYLSKLGHTRQSDVEELLQPAYALHSQSPFVKRLQDWPRGYAGDFETIEYLMNGLPQISEENDAFWIEWYALNTPIAYQHRNKLLFQRDSCISAAHNGECNVLSVGCGGSYDLNMLRTQLNTNFHFTLIDIEKDAVALSEQRLSWASSVTPMVGDAIRKVRSAGSRYDIIIFGGLFDYLDSRAISIILKSAFPKLLPEGRIIFTNVSGFSTFDIWLERLARWRMIYRSEQDIVALVESSGLRVDSLSIDRDSTCLTSLCTLRNAQ
jgi:extracellular factor (EF) 3-hydroxypalmitic acid methyl ester biosynthesis protein